MATFISRFEQKLYAIEQTICSLSLLIMLFTVAFGVCIRFFDLPIPNVAEWALVAMSPLAFVGAAMCSYMRSHIAVDLIEQLNIPALHLLTHFVVALLMTAFAVLYAWLGWILLADVITTGERLLDMGTPLYVPIFFLFAGMVLMSFHSIFELLRATKLLRTLSF